MSSIKYASDRTHKNGSAELLILAQIETRARHGYEIACVIERRSGGAVSFQPASLYPVLYRLERKGWIAGRWVAHITIRRWWGAVSRQCKSVSRSIPTCGSHFGICQFARARSLLHSFA